MASLYEMFEEIDDEMLFIMDCVSAIREMVEKGQKKKALEALIQLEEEIDEFLSMPVDEEEPEEEETEDEE
jgi:cell division protein ZapA (FtsZ GTPase activity inhibitor)